MTRKEFVTRYTSFVQYVIKLVKEAKRCGIESLEDWIWDIEEMEKVCKEGLRLIVAEAYPATVNEILSNMIAHEKDKYMRLYKTIQKRAVLGIQAGESILILYKALSSLAGLPSKEEHQIELSLLTDDDAEPPNGSVKSIPLGKRPEGTYDAELETNTQEDESETELSPFDEAILVLNDSTIKIIVNEFDANVLAYALKPSGKKVRERFYNIMYKRHGAMLKEDIGYIGTGRSEEARQMILTFLQNLADYVPSKNSKPRGFPDDKVNNMDLDDLDLDGNE